ncbi:MAG TPA: pilin [Candidatus Paceibacterota bacterium]|nr:pilin [Candidatus Paceibacterota bacterium]
MFDFVKIASAQGIVPCGGPGQPACTSWDNLSQLINNLITFLLEVSIPLAVLVILYGGFLILTAAGSEGRYEQGKNAIIGAVIGLFIVFGSYILVSLITRALSG